MNSVVPIGNDLHPDLRGARVLAAPLGHLRQLAACPRAKFRRQSNLQGLRARGVRTIVLSPALQKSR